MAQKNLKEFRRSAEPSLSNIKGLKYDLAWVEGMAQPLQLAVGKAKDPLEADVQ